MAAAPRRERQRDRIYDHRRTHRQVQTHHGSRWSSTPAFIKAVDPGWAVISCGAGNDYGHPHGSVLNRLKNLRTGLYRTDKQGDIVFYFTDGGILFEKEPCNDYTPG